MTERPSRPSPPVPILCGALVASAASLSALAWLSVPRIEAPVAPGAIALWALVAAALVPLIVAPAIERALPASAQARGASVERARAVGTIVGFALREATALLGALVTYWTGQRIFVAMLGGFALLAMLLAWPSPPSSDSIEPS